MNNQDFLFSFLLSKQAKNHLENRNVAVESNFTITQSLIGWMLHDPWIFTLLLQKELDRLEDVSHKSADAEIRQLESESAALRSTVSERDTTIGNLESENAALRSTVSERNTTIGNLESENAALRNAMNEQDTTIGNLKKENEVLQRMLKKLKNKTNVLHEDKENRKLAQDYSRGELTIKQARKEVRSDGNLPPGKKDEEETQVTGKTTKRIAGGADDLTQLLGIGPKVQALLNRNDIFTFGQLAGKTEEELGALLEKAQTGPGVIHPETWIAQARLLAEGRREEWLEWKKKFRQ